MERPAEKPRIILASASPRRRELLERICRGFETEIADVDETVPDEIGTDKTAEYLSGIKAREIYNRHRGENVAVIGSDTVVLSDGRIYGKPHTAEEAVSMLNELSGRIHEVRTGTTVIYGDGEGLTEGFSFTETARVEFYELSGADIDEYIATGEPFDKAGAYGIQGQGCLLVRSIEGDFYTIMGLPVSRLYRELKARNLI